MKKENKILMFGGAAVGILNGLFGAGGGMLMVPLLNKAGFEQQEAHKNCVAIIFPMSLLSSVLYLTGGRMTVSDALPFLPAGIIGALIGTWIIKKIKGNILKKIFAVFMLWAGVRLIMK